MAAGKTHDEIAIASGVFLGLAIGLLTSRWDMATPIGAGCLIGGYWLSPDLDIRSRPYHRWGVLRWLWLPYQKSLRHRSFWSHGPIVGTTGRVVYLAGCFGLLLLVGLAVTAIASSLLGAGSAYQQVESTLIGRLSEALAGLWQHQAVVCGLFFIGLELGALGHILADWVSSGFRWRSPSSKPRRPRGLTQVRSTRSINSDPTQAKPKPKPKQPANQRPSQPDQPSRRRSTRSPGAKSDRAKASPKSPKAQKSSGS